MSRATPEISTAIVNGARLVCDLSGALLWPDKRAVIVADLHLEKGSAFAARGQLLPPYDTAATLERLASVLQRHRPKRVLCLGDSFHDGGAADRLAGPDLRTLRQLTETAEWIWIRGNHDPAPPVQWGGHVEIEVALGALVFRHAPHNDGVHAGEVAGHFHPKAAVTLRNKRVTARCFASDGRRIVLPAFGAYTGGLNVLDPAISTLFRWGFQVHVLGQRGVYMFPHTQLSP